MKFLSSSSSSSSSCDSSSNHRSRNSLACFMTGNNNNYNNINKINKEYYQSEQNRQQKLQSTFSSSSTSMKSGGVATATDRIKRVVTCFILVAQHPPTQSNNANDIIDSSNNNYRVGLFHRSPTMPTYPSHYASISGSIEYCYNYQTASPPPPPPQQQKQQQQETDSSTGTNKINTANVKQYLETPVEAILRELKEETNIIQLFTTMAEQEEKKEKLGLDHVCSKSSSSSSSSSGGDFQDEYRHVRKYLQGGLYHDVYDSPSTTTTIETKPITSTTTIRVYPFLLKVPFQYSHLFSNSNNYDKDHQQQEKEENNNNKFQLCGTEHDYYKFISVSQFLSLLLVTQYDDNKQPLVVVPKLLTTFYHATCYDPSYYITTINNNDEEIQKQFIQLPLPVETWRCNTSHGASTLAKQMIDLCIQHFDLLMLKNDDFITCSSSKSDLELDQDGSSSSSSCSCSILEALRPTMIPIVNVVRAFTKELKMLLSKRTRTMQQQPQEHPQLYLKTTGIINNETMLNEVGNTIRHSLGMEMKRVIRISVNAIQALIDTKIKNWNNNDNKKFVIATFSRSSTIVSIINCIIEQNNIIRDNNQVVEFVIQCARSTPGNEGEIMARQDFTMLQQQQQQQHSRPFRVQIVDDDELEKKICQGNEVDVLLVGADCVMTKKKSKNGTAQVEESSRSMNNAEWSDFGINTSEITIVNKIGTRALAYAAQQSRTNTSGSTDQENNNNNNGTLLYCCADRWKIWNDDIFPPPLEDVFELIPGNLFDRILVPPPHSSISTSPSLLTF